MSIKLTFLLCFACPCNSKLHDDKEMKYKQAGHDVEIIKERFKTINTHLLRAGLDLNELRTVPMKHRCRNHIGFAYMAFSVVVLSLCILYEVGLLDYILSLALGVRCIVPNNYFVWEATRPVSNCNFCTNISEPIVLHNVTREEFAVYAYSSKPIIVKKAFLHWPAMKYFDFDFFKKLYESFEDSYRSVDEECQFLHFQSNFISLRDVFAMNEARIKHEPGEQSWYVGWGNCHPQILSEMRRYYPKPHFLPEDCEIPSKEYVFMGYDAGATMHLDFINRLMWQAQLKGTKTWHLIPAPECENTCHSFTFVVEPGDAILVDTRVWYHGTTIAPGEFSLSIQSEYG